MNQFPDKWRIDRTVISTVDLTADSDEIDYWLTKTPDNKRSTGRLKDLADVEKLDELKRKQQKPK